METLGDFEQSVVKAVLPGTKDKDVAVALGVDKFKVTAAMIKILRAYEVPNRTALVYKILSNQIAELKVA
jgi:DNA-binding NarL/FixJ family response regulator